MARTRRLAKNYEERGSHVEDSDKALRDRVRVSRDAGPAGKPPRPRAPARPPDEGPRLGGEDVLARAVDEAGAASPPVARRTRSRRRVPRAADRKRFAHERPPAEPIVQRPDH